MESNWQRRWHPLLKDWVLIAANTAERPWSGMEFSEDHEAAPTHDPSCYLCPEVQRASGDRNPNYQKPWAFDNDFASLSFEAPAIESSEDELLKVAPAHGVCRVMCWHPRHDLTIAMLKPSEVLDVVYLWKEQYLDLKSKPGISHIMQFENKGKEIGVSNPHPHGQIYASAFVPKQIEQMRQSQAEYFADYKSTLILDYLNKPKCQDLMVSENEFFMASVPFAARFSYEVWLSPKRHCPHIAELSSEELAALAALYQEMVKRYNSLYKREAPNITLIQNAPVDEDLRNEAWQFHIVMQPPLRDPHKLKYLAGFESGTNCIVNPVQPELAAERLRSQEI